MVYEGILAQFDGECEICEAEIVADEDMITQVDGDWVHFQCAVDEGYVEEPR